MSGRPPVYNTDAERAAARKVSKAKFKTVGLDADLVGTLNAVCDNLEPELGFRPTLSQAIRHLIKRAANGTS